MVRGTGLRFSFFRFLRPIKLFFLFKGGIRQISYKVSLVRFLDFNPHIFQFSDITTINDNKAN